jgi:ATP-dependent Clp protease ATP-binding subunit ClpC
VQKTIKREGINLIVELSVQAFLTDEGYDPLYGARPLRRAIMKYLEDTLAAQCLSKPYILIRRFMFVERK